MIKIIVIAALFASTSALAQPAGTSTGSAQSNPPPTDQEIAEAHKLCDTQSHRIPAGIIRQPLPEGFGPGQYKPEWKQCNAIDAEHEKRGLAAKAKQADDQKRLDSIIGRIK